MPAPRWSPRLAQARPTDFATHITKRSRPSRPAWSRPCGAATTWRCQAGSPLRHVQEMKFALDDRFAMAPHPIARTTRRAPSRASTPTTTSISRRTKWPLNDTFVKSTLDRWKDTRLPGRGRVRDDAHARGGHRSRQQARRRLARGPTRSSASWRTWHSGPATSTSGPDNHQAYKDAVTGFSMNPRI